MQGTWVALFIIILCCIIIPQRRRKLIRAALLVKKKKGIDPALLKLTEEYIGQDCIVSVSAGRNYDAQGIIISCENGWLFIKEPSDDKPTAVNMLHVTAVRRYPYRNGKRAWIA